MSSHNRAVKFGEIDLLSLKTGSLDNAIKVVLCSVAILVYETL